MGWKKGPASRPSQSMRPLRIRLDQLPPGILQVEVQQPLGLSRVARLQGVDNLLVAGEVRLVEAARVVHDVERQPQLGEHAAHQVVGAGAARQSGQRLVEVDVRGRAVRPPAVRRRPLAAW